MKKWQRELILAMTTGCLIAWWFTGGKFGHFAVAVVLAAIAWEYRYRSPFPMRLRPLAKRALWLGLALGVPGGTLLRNPQTEAGFIGWLLAVVAMSFLAGIFTMTTTIAAADFLANKSLETGGSGFDEDEFSEEE